VGSPQVVTLEQIAQIPRPLVDGTSPVPRVRDMVNDILWSDPMPREGQRGTVASPRGTSCLFGVDRVERVLAANPGLEKIVRSHQVGSGWRGPRIGGCTQGAWLMQVVMEGFEFFADQRLITVFSATNYCGSIENDGAVLDVNTRYEVHPLTIAHRRSAPSEPTSSKWGRVRDTSPPRERPGRR
jgi:protein phosphatase